MKNINCIKFCVLALTLSVVGGCATNGSNQSMLGSADEGLSTVEQTAQSGRQIMQSGTAAAQGIDAAGQLSLTDTLSRQLGISQHQALGGAGAIFQTAQGNMDSQSFATISQSVPEMSDMMNAAPDVLPDSVSGMADGMAPMIGSGTIGDGSGGLGSMMGNSGVSSGASLAASFQQLNLSPEMVNQFIPIITDYVSNTGSQAAANLLRSALPMP